MFKIGDIVFIMHHDSWLSRTIAKFMGSNWGHTAIIYDISQTKKYILETTEYKIKITNLDDYINDPMCSLAIYQTDLSEGTRQDIINECYKFNGHIYGYLQLISLGIRRLLMRCGIVIKNFIRQSLVCNQLVLYGYQKSNIKELNIDPESIDTEELFQIVSTSSNFKKVFEKHPIIN